MLDLGTDLQSSTMKSGGKEVMEMSESDVEFVSPETWAAVNVEGLVLRMG